MDSQKSHSRFFTRKNSPQQPIEIASTISDLCTLTTKSIIISNINATKTTKMFNKRLCSMSTWCFGLQRKRSNKARKCYFLRELSIHFSSLYIHEILKNVNANNKMTLIYKKMTTSGKIFTMVEGQAYSFDIRLY